MINLVSLLFYYKKNDKLFYIDHSKSLYSQIQRIRDSETYEDVPLRCHQNQKSSMFGIKHNDEQNKKSFSLSLVADVLSS